MRGSHDQFAAGDQNLFVGESDGATEFHGFVSSFEADYTYGGGENDFGAGVRAYSEHAFPAVMNGGKRRETCFAEPAGKFVGEFFIGHGNDFRVVALDLRKELFEIVASGQGDDFELVGEGFDDLKRLAAYGAGGTEDG